MKLLGWIRDPRQRLDIVAGLIDGILNSLTLAAAKLTSAGALDPWLIAKVGTITACSTCFVFFVAHYAQLRADLIRSARELNLLSHGRLVTTRLGTQVLYEAISGAVVASLSGVVGSILPLLVGWSAAQIPMAGVAVAIGLLGVLGWILARTVFGSPAYWAGGLMIGGAIVTLIGVKLNVLA